MRQDVEAVGGFKAVPQMLRVQDPNLDVVDITPIGDKFTRALPVAAAWRDGRVRLPGAASWLEDFLDEVKIFTGLKDIHDDQVDRFEKFDQLYWDSNLVNGAIPICHHGCALRTWLVVTCDQRGHVWHDGRADQTGLTPHQGPTGEPQTFADWYEAWLAKSLETAGA